MKKLVLVFLLVAGAYRLKAQELMQMAPSDSLKKSMLNKQLQAKPGNNLQLMKMTPSDKLMNSMLDKRLKTRPGNNLPMLKVTPLDTISKNLLVKPMPNSNMKLLIPMMDNSQLFGAVTMPQSNITISPVDHMPILRIAGNSKMPVAKLSGNDNMVITPLKTDPLKPAPLP